MSKSGLMLARVLSSLIPEEQLLERVITDLTEYKEAKFASKDTTEEVTTGSLAEFIASQEEETVGEIEPPMSGLMSLIVKWQDQGKSVEEIMEDSVNFEQEISKTNLKDD